MTAALHIRPYRAASKAIAVLALCFVAALQPHPLAAQEASDNDKLGMAVEYFQSGKYHEALLLFRDLNGRYRLNPRLEAYMGVCCYYEWEFEEACAHIDSVADRLEVLAPQERSVYYYCSAESHFALGRYDEAAQWFERMLLVCHDNEKGDALYRIGFCHVQRQQWALAKEYLESALAYYTRFGGVNDKPGRVPQIRNMIVGCDEKIKNGVTQ